MGEQIDETVFSAGAKRRRLSQRQVTGWPGFGESIYIYIRICERRRQETDTVTVTDSQKE